MPAIAPGETERFGARTSRLYRHERKTATSRLTTGKPHVLLVGPLPPPPLLGGVETGVALLLGSQLAATTSMRLFNVARAEDPARRFHQRLAYQVGTCLRFARAIVQARPRIVHVKTSSGLNFYQNVLYVAIARLLGRRVLLQLHSGGFPNFFDNASGPARALIRAALRLPDGLIVLSEGWARYFQTLAAGRPITVVPNALPTAEYADATPNREAFGIPEHRVALLFVGTRHRALDVAKGFRELVRAAAQVRSRHPELLVVVAGAAADLTELEAALGPPGDGWLHVGVIATEDKATLYRSVDLFALPSHYENMPNTILEALAAGLPIVATPVGAIAEMVDEGANGFLVPVGDVDALAARIERMVADRELRRRMSACAAETAARKFDLSVLEQQLREAYASLGLSTAPAPIVWYRQPRVQRRVRLVGRLIHMPPREIAHRGRRVAAKRAARLRLQVRPRLSRGTDERTSDLLPLKDDPALSLAQRARSLGFFDVRERQDRVALAHERLRPQVERTLSQAAAILTEGIDLLGCHVRPTAAGFDWLADPERGRLWPLTVLDDSDAVRRVPADVKVVWEINRHQFLVTLARAHAYGGDERYARACIDMVRGWIVANPPPLGVNWASNLEVAIRSLSWVWALHFLMGTTALTASDCRLWLASLRRHRDYLAAHLSTYTDPTNHLIGEAAALAVLSIWLPEWDGSARLRTVALSTLARELERQVAPDGIDREQTMSYQRFVLDLLLQVIALADRNAIALPTILRSRARAMLRAVAILVGPNQRAPRIGDSDDARGLPFFADDLWNFGDVLALGAAVVGGAHELCPGGRACESALWLTGDTGAAVAQDGWRVEPWSGSAMLPEGGYAVLRSAQRPAEDRLVFDCGPLGYAPHASHGHADLLSVLADVDGQEVLIDPGTFAYYDAAGRRDLFRSTRTHNTVEVGGRDQADMFDPFKWLNLPRHGVEVCRLGQGFDYVEAWHDGYRRLRPAVRHRRAVLGAGGGWLLIDWIEGEGAHEFSRWFHAVPDARVEQIDSAAVRITPPAGRAALLLRDIVGENGEDPTEVINGLGPYSERYGQQTDAPVVRFVDRALLPAIRLTLLTPEREPPRRGGLALAETAGARAAGGLWVRLTEAPGVRVEVAVRAPGVPLRVGPIETDARVVIVRVATGSPATVFTSGGNRVEGLRAF